MGGHRDDLRPRWGSLLRNATARALAEKVWDKRDLLTDRRRQVLREAEGGLSTVASATRLGLSEGAADRAEAARKVREQGWL